jgi:SdpC family antimicrobial peptide
LPRSISQKHALASIAKGIFQIMVISHPGRANDIRLYNEMSSLWCVQKNAIKPIVVYFIVVVAPLLRFKYSHNHLVKNQMKTIRKISKSRLLLISLALMIGFISCEKDRAAEKTNAFNGKELMLATFFGSGPAADLLPEVKQSLDPALFTDDTQEIEMIKRVQNEMLDNLEKGYPGSFDDFRFRMQSGDHIVIENTLTEYVNKLGETIKTSFGATEVGALEANRNDVAKIIAKYDAAPQDVNDAKSLIENPEFRTEINTYLKSVRLAASGSRVSSSESGLCAVGPIAAIATFVIYAFFILAWMVAYNWTYLKWTPLPRFIKNARDLRMDQLVNTVAVNF